MAAIYNLPTTQTFYNSSINVPVNVWAWAVGSGTYVGATWDTTSLRETGPGRWEQVTSC